ncbi:MAG: mechanosensitive ion channel domain-containing protein [Casimicrobiaceae bacterium]
MLTPIDFSLLRTVLQSTSTWIEVLVVLACVGLAWRFDRKLEERSRATANDSYARLHGGVARLLFPLTAILLLLLAHFIYRRAGGDPFFIDIAIPLLIALGVIRMLVYGMRRLFAAQTWLKTSERAISFSIWTLAALYFVGVLPEIWSELDTVVLPIGRSSVTLLTISKGLLALIVTVVVTLYLSGVIEGRLRHATSLDNNTQALLSKLIRAALLVVGVLIALQWIGFDLTLLTVFGGALGVGIGLGLQKFAANYIAGFTILIDKSIRLGDIITVDGRHGTVARVTNRYVVVRSADGVEAIVPNETLVTTTVLNHSLNSRVLRVTLPLQVAANADVEQALELMLAATRRESRVLQDVNPPLATLNGFVDGAISLELAFSLRDPELGPGTVRSAINRQILSSFRTAGIEISPPRRDLGRVPPAAGST